MSSYQSMCVLIAQKLQRCDFEPYKWIYPSGQTVDGLNCKNCAHKVIPGFWALLGTPKDTYETPGFYYHPPGGYCPGHPGNTPFQITKVIQASGYFQMQLENNFHYNAEWVLKTYDTKPTGILPDFSNVILPEPKVGPPAPASSAVAIGNSATVSVGGVDGFVAMGSAAEAPACTCTSLLFGHMNGCSYAKAQKTKNVQEGRWWR